MASGSSTDPETLSYIADYFRCPGSPQSFQLTGRLSQDSGYFVFGPGAVCYAKSSGRLTSKHATGPLHDLLTDVTVDAGIVRLPFDPNEIIENLRYERYVRDQLGTRAGLAENPTLRDIYYRLRPFLPVAVRKHLQKLALKDWTNIRFPSWPVDSTVERILERLLVLSMRAQGLQRVPFIWFWPHGATSCAIMTHDVESLAGRDFCSQLMDLDDSVRIKSSFQIVPESRYPVPATLLEEIRTRRFEVNIHDLNHDGHLFSNYGEFRRRVERINQYGRTYGASGFRSGGLYRNHAWYDALDFSYDMSVPSTGHLEPQRGGCCSVMPFFIGGILELPLTTTQDYSLFHILNDYSIDLWKRQLRAIMEKHGLASFLVHPDYIREQRARRSYQALIEHLARMRDDHQVWIALPTEVDRWWRQRRQLRVVYDGDKYSIDGEGWERARLAFATLVDDRLTFTIEGRG